MAKRKRKFSYEEAVRRINEDPDFIIAPQHQYSLKSLLSKHPDGISDWNAIAKYLAITPEKAQQIYYTAMAKIKQYLLGQVLNKKGDLCDN